MIRSFVTFSLIVLKMVLRNALEFGFVRVWSEDFNAGRKYAGIEVKNPFKP